MNIEISNIKIIRLSAYLTSNKIITQNHDDNMQTDPIFTVNIKYIRLVDTVIIRYNNVYYYISILAYFIPYSKYYLK